MPLVVGEVEVNPGPPVEVENTDQILTKVRNKDWARTEAEKWLKYCKQQFGQTRKETKKYQEKLLKTYQTVTKF